MQQSCRDAGRPSPVSSWLQGWEDLDLDFSAQVEEQSYRGAPSPSSMEINKIDDPSQIFDRSAQGPENSDHDKTQLRDMAMKEVTATSSQNSVGQEIAAEEEGPATAASPLRIDHREGDVVGGDSSSGGLTRRPRDVTQTDSPVVKVEPMTVDGETPPKVTRLQSYLNVVLGKEAPSGVVQIPAADALEMPAKSLPSAGGTTANPKVQNFLDVVLGRNRSKAATAPEEEPAHSAADLQHGSQSPPARTISPKRKAIEASAMEPEDLQPAKRPITESSTLEVESSGRASGHVNANLEVLREGSADCVEQGTDIAGTSAQEAQGLELAVKGDKVGGDEDVDIAVQAGKEGDDEDVGIVVQVEKEGGDECAGIAVQAGKEGGDEDMGTALQVDKEGGDEDTSFAIQGDKEGCEQGTGSAVMEDDDLGLASTVAGDKNCDAQARGLGVKVDREGGDQGPGLGVDAPKEGGYQGSGLVVGCVKKGGNQGIVFVSEGCTGGIKKCTDLTDLLDALSEDSDCPDEDDEELDEDEVDRHIRWWQAPPAMETEESVAIAPDRENPTNTLPRVTPSINVIPRPSHGIDPKTAISVADCASLVQTAAVESRRGASSGEGSATTSSEIERDRFHQGLVTSRSPPCERQLPNMADSLAMHTIDISLELTRRVRDDDGGPTLREVNFLQRVGRSAPEIVILDSDSDDDGDVVICDHGDESSRFRHLVKLEHEVSRNSMGNAAEDVVEGNDDHHAVVPSVATSGTFQHMFPGVSPPRGDGSGFADAANPPSAHNHALCTGSSPGVSLAAHLGPGNVHPIWSHTSARDHYTGITGTKAPTQVEEWMERWYQGQGQRIPGNQLKAGTSACGIVSQGNAAPNAHATFKYRRILPAPDFKYLPQQNVPLPLPNGQSHGSASMRERLVQANRACSSTPPPPCPVLAASLVGQQASPGQSRVWPARPAVAPSSPDTAFRERISPLSIYSPHMRNADITWNLGSSPLQNRPSTSTPPAQERRPTANHHSWHHQTYSGGPGKVEAISNDGHNLGPHTPQSNNQLMIVKPDYDSTVSTPRVTVTRALELYNYYLQVAQVKLEEQRREYALRALKSDPALGSLRPDIQAYNDMKQENEDVNRSLVVGDVPGVEVGDVYTYRHQMAVVGLHHLPNVGIAYGYPTPENIITATAVVCVPKGGYADNVDNGYKVLYTGQGGRSERTHSAPFVEHQKLEKGNKALWSNFERKVPVRMIRAHANIANASSRKLLGYTYDGLYVIVHAAYGLGVGGFNVYKFSLERLEDQPPISACIQGCTAHPWNDAQRALAPLPLQMVEPEEDMEVKRILGVEDAAADVAAR